MPRKSRPSEKIKKSPEFAPLRTAAPASEVLGAYVRAESVRLARAGRGEHGPLRAIADLLGISPDYVTRRAAGDDPKAERIAPLVTGSGLVAECTVDDREPGRVTLDYTVIAEDGTQHAYEIVVNAKNAARPGEG